MSADREDRARREHEARRARQRHFREMDRNLRMKVDRETRLLLDEFFPAGAPEGLLERLCLAQNKLVKDIIGLEKAARELHDGINRIADEAAQREVTGYNTCAEQVRAHARELGLADAVTDSLLRNHVRMQESERAERDRAATRKVEWSRT